MSKGKERASSDEEGLFQERLETFLNKELADLRAFAEREGRLFDEVGHTSYCIEMNEYVEWIRLIAVYRLESALRSGTANIYSVPHQPPRARAHKSRNVVSHLPLSSSLPLFLLFTSILTISDTYFGFRITVLEILRSTSRILESLHDLAGLQSFFLVVNPHDPEDEGFLGGTVLGREFWRGHRGCGVAGAEAFRTQCVKAITAHPNLVAGAGATTPMPNQTHAYTHAHAHTHTHTHAQPHKQTQAHCQPPVQMLNMKSQKKGPAVTLKMGIYADVRNALRSISGTRNAEMKWSDHAKLAIYGVRLVGWPQSVPKQNPSTLSMAQNRLVREALDGGGMYFERLVAAECERDATGVGSSPLSDQLPDAKPGAEQEEVLDDAVNLTSWTNDEPQTMSPVRYRIPCLVFT